MKRNPDEVICLVNPLLLKRLPHLVLAMVTTKSGATCAEESVSSIYSVEGFT